MTRAILALALLAGFALRAPAQLASYDPPRSWKMADGQAFTASVTAFDGTTVSFRMPNGQKVQAPVTQLAAEEHAYLADWRKKQPITVIMPDVVGVESSTLAVEVVSEDERNGKFVYRTPHFEFESQGKFTQSLLREVARNFEATYELLKALPWGIEPRPPSGPYFRARLLRTKSAYHEAGAPQNSGGVYMGGEEIFLVPFESIGLKEVGKSYAKDDNFETHTLVHELTHQMMHFWLRMLPQWVVEGTAEYTAMLPLRTGKFRVSSAKTGLKDYLDFLKRHAQGGVPMPFPLEELFTISNQKWNAILEGDPRMSSRLYFTSYLLVYYFMHLDGAGDGQLFVKYFREIGTERRKVEEYYAAVEAFKKLPGVEILPDGRYRWQGDLTHPVKPDVLASPEALEAFQKRTLDILLNGRSEAQLMDQIRSAYKRLGVKV